MSRGKLAAGRALQFVGSPAIQEPISTRQFVICLRSSMTSLVFLRSQLVHLKGNAYKSSGYTDAGVQQRDDAMAVSDDYVEFITDQLEGLGRVFARRMFGGVGLYCDDFFFGLIADDALYFKTDESTRARYVAAGAPPFRPYGDDSYPMSYYEVPASVLEDRDELLSWAKVAVEVAARKRLAKENKSTSRRKSEHGGRRPRK